MADRRRGGGSAGASTGPAGMAHNRRLILGFMYGYYEEALDALPQERMSVIAPCILQGGVCFGFGDPVTNIVANTLSFVLDENGEPARGEPVPEPDGAARNRKRKRKTKSDARAKEEILSKIVAGDGDGDAPSPPEARTVAEHSLEGLVTFLTTYFRYLPSWDALRYLCVAKSDLLVAVRLIELDRCYHREDKFHIHFPAVKTALKCAALSARLPNVDAFLTGSFALVSHLVHNVLAENCYLCHSELLEKPPRAKERDTPMNLAATRCQHDMKVSPVLTESLRATLLDRIHTLYLEAISRIPMEDFRRHYHRGLLKAGYCYGPFNPLFNIIVNTVWYDAAFPAPQELELDMISTPLLIHIESRSLDGLVNLLLDCISGISEHDAMIYLLKSNLKLFRAIQMAGKDGHDTSGRGANAYTAAALASSHPQLEAYVHFVMESLPMVKSPVRKLLDTQTLTSSEILQLSMLLSSSRSHPSKSLELPDKLTKDAMEMVSSYKENFFSKQNFAHKKVEATLLNCEQSKYELRFICTVNENVGSKSFRDLKYPYSHVNFWASPKDKTCLTLFFAQVSNHDEDSKHNWSFCQPLPSLSTNVRCCYCQFEGTRIVHPVENYCGGVDDFEKMATGKHTITNERIISHGKLMSSSFGKFDDGCIYFDPGRDVKFIEAMNEAAWEAKLNWSDEIRKFEQTEALQMYKKGRPGARSSRLHRDRGKVRPLWTHYKCFEELQENERAEEQV